MIQEGERNAKMTVMLAPCFGSECKKIRLIIYNLYSAVLLALLSIIHDANLIAEMDIKKKNERDLSQKKRDDSVNILRCGKELSSSLKGFTQC